MLALVSGCASTPTDAANAEKSTAGEAADLTALEATGLAAIEARPADPGATFVLHDARIMTANGAVHDPGWVAVADGLIVGVGGGEPPSDMGGQRLAMTDKVITPGIVDTHSHLGVYPSPSIEATRDGNEATQPNTAGVWAEHSFWPQDPGIERAVRGGVTTIQVLPGSANLIGGRGVVLTMRPTRGARAMRFRGAPETLKMACGENPKRVYGRRKRSPSTRMGNVRGHRDAFLSAQKWLSKQGDKSTEDVERDLANESLAGLMQGRVLAQVHCYRADDMLTFLQLAKEFGFRVRSFHHAVEAYKIRDVLAAYDVSVSTWADWWGFKHEAYDAIVETAALVSEAGGRAVIHSDSAEGIQRLNQEAAKAMAAGRSAGIAVTDDEGLRWITANAAWTLGIDAYVGTLEVGKRADIVVWNGDPFSVYTSAERVYIDGQLIVDGGTNAPPWSDFEAGQEVPR